MSALQDEIPETQDNYTHERPPVTFVSTGRALDRSSLLACLPLVRIDGFLPAQAAATTDLRAGPALRAVWVRAVRFCGHCGLGRFSNKATARVAPDLGRVCGPCRVGHTALRGPLAGLFKASPCMARDCPTGHPWAPLGLSLPCDP